MRTYPPVRRTVKTLRRPEPPEAPRLVPRPVPLLSLVVPVYNLPPARLSDTLDELADYRRARGADVELVLVDDGSDAPTASELERFARRAPHVALLRNGRNSGKGRAVARGLLAARGQVRVFTDADLAYPAAEVDHIVTAIEAGHDIAIACRVLPESRYLMSPAFFPYLYSRHVMSRFFNSVVRGVLIPEILDSQAGLKGLTEAAVMDLVPRLTIDGFAFDVELLYAAWRRGYRIAQTPVFFRYDSEPSTMHFALDGARMLRDIARIRLNGARGRYS